MAISEMQKVRMAVHKSVADELMRSIQKLGCCHFISDGHDKADGSEVAPLRAKLRTIDEHLGEARSVTRFLETFDSKRSGSQPSMSLDELAKAASDDAFKPTSDKIHSIERRLADVRAGISRASGLIGQVKQLEGLPCALDFYVSGSDLAVGGVYSVPAAQLDELKAQMTKSAGDMFELTVMPSSGKESTRVVSLICSREKLSAMQEALGRVGASRVDVPSGLTGTAAEELVSLTKELDSLKATEKSLIAEAEAFLGEAEKETRLFADYWTIEKNRAETLIDGEQTEMISIYKFWIPKAKMNEFNAMLSKYSDLTDVTMIEPDEGELAPTLLSNKGIADPVEPLIEMYGTPTYGGLDPTAIVAPFFYMFFGICFGDAGYGLLIASLLIFIMIKKRLTGTVRKFAMILILGNICAVIFGAISFSWFGDSIAAFGGEKYPGFTFLSFLSPLGKLQILDPMTDPMTMLYVSLALGFIQIMVGLLVAMSQNIRNGKTFAAFADQGGWMIFLIGLVLVGLSGSGVIGLASNVSAGVAIVGALILVATQGREKKNPIAKLFSGVMSLYNVTGYLGDVLSYSRLLALGLGSAAVGMVINLLVTLVAGIPYVGPVLGVVVFILGHLFGIAANILGAFVHSLRLQYVEFFGKFHEAAGYEFKPLSVATQFVKISDR